MLLTIPDKSVAEGIAALVTLGAALAALQFAAGDDSCVGVVYCPHVSNNPILSSGRALEPNGGPPSEQTEIFRLEDGKLELGTGPLAGVVEIDIAQTAQWRFRMSDPANVELEWSSQAATSVQLTTNAARCRVTTRPLTVACTADEAKGR